jgi:hypothetical protein
MPIILIEVTSLLTLGLATFYYVWGAFAKRQMDRIEYTTVSIPLLLISTLPYIVGTID